MIKRVFMISFCCITILSIILGTCQFNTVDNTVDKKVTMVMSNIEANDIETKSGILQLELEDFSVFSEQNLIQLGALFERSIGNNMEKEESSDYVGEIYKEDQPCYKVYIHYFADFNIYTSNLNYDVENRDFDTYIIQQITLKSSVYKTNRGISIGSSLKDVTDVYGEGIKSLENTNRTLVYSLGNKSIKFMFGKYDIVDSIVLVIS